MTRPDADGEVAHLGVAHDSGGKTHRLSARLEQHVGIPRPQRVPHRGLGQRDGVSGAGRCASPAVEDHQRRAPRLCRRWPARALTVASNRTMRANDSTLRLAPPTSTPSMSGWAISSSMLSGLTLPPYRMRTASAASFPAASASRRRMKPIASWAISGVAVLPGADGPHRLVGYRHPLGVLQLQQAPGPVASCRERTSSVLPCVALGFGLAHAHDGKQAVIERGVHLLLHARVGLAEVLPPLGVPDDDGAHAQSGTASAARPRPCRLPLPPRRRPAPRS